MEKQSRNWFLYLSAIPIIGIAFYFSQSVSQPDFYEMVGCFIPFFLFYALIWLSVRTEREIWFFVGTALLARLILIFALPNLSDDFYRFIWDGRLINAGINPFMHLPADVLTNPAVTILENSGNGVFDNLNSQNYYSVYPPVNQLIFAISSFVFPNSIAGSVGFMKGVFLLSEIGTIWLIIRLCGYFKLPKKTVLLYALNPLIILETFNNLHFEIMMIFLLALSLWWLVNERLWWSSVAMALAIGCKLLPLMFLPFLIKAIGGKQSLRYFLYTGLILILVFSPVLNGFFVKNFIGSIDLYFRKFEFNASVYYVLRWFGYKITGHNIIHRLGPFLGLITMAYVVLRAFWEQPGKTNRLPLNWMLAMTAFLLLSTTVHPWYLSSIIFLCLFTDFRYPVAWSGLILLTYINYSFNEYTEVLWIVGVEYLFLALFMWYEGRRAFVLSA